MAHLRHVAERAPWIVPPIRVARYIRTGTKAAELLYLLHYLNQHRYDRLEMHIDQLVITVYIEPYN